MKMFAVLFVSLYCFSSWVEAQSPVSCDVKLQAYGGVSSSACPVGFVDVNGKQVWSSAWCTADLAVRKRGVSTMILDTNTCIVSDWRTWDTFASDDDAADLASYIDYLARGKVLIGVTGDEPTSKLNNAKRQLRVAGVRVDDVQSRGSFAFVIQVGFPEQTAFDKQINSATNPNTVLAVTVKRNLAGYVDVIKA